jgi:hypothetical protein
MKEVGKAELIWAAVSMVIIGVSFRYGWLLYGLVLVYGLMAGLFVYRIVSIRRRMSRSVAVYGTVTGYRQPKSGRGYIPVVAYETETGRDISSVYSYVDKEMLYETGTEKMICYDPDDPMFFYFADRESDLTRDYFTFLVFGGVIAAAVLIAALAR